VTIGLPRRRPFCLQAESVFSLSIFAVPIRLFTEQGETINPPPKKKEEP
jgi:hypothetical protein